MQLFVQPSPAHACAAVSLSHSDALSEQCSVGSATGCAPPQRVLHVALQAHLILVCVSNSQHVRKDLYVPSQG